MTLPRIVTAVLAFVLLSTGSASAAGVRLTTRDEPIRFAGIARIAAASGGVLPARQAPIRFNMVGLHWRGSGALSFRTAPATGRWSPWRPARPEAEDLPDPGSVEARRLAGWNLGNPYWTGPAHRIQYRTAGPVSRLRAHFFWSPPRAVASKRPVARSLAIPSTPSIISRAAWGADESIVRAGPGYADRLAFAVVHHTAGTTPSSPGESAAIVRGIQAYHVKSNGWNDIGYNFLVDPFGQIFEGRAGGITRNVVGAHAQGFNTGSVGVGVLGTYVNAPISQGAREALVALLAWRLDLAHVDPLSRLTRISGGSSRFREGTPVVLDAVSGHRDTAYTICPGDVLYGELGSLAAATAARGLPKLYDPRVEGALGGPIRFTARLSTPLAWTVRVFDAAGATLASGSGAGTSIAWTWDASGFPAGRYSYAIEAGPDVRAARGPIGALLPLELTDLAARPPVLTPNGDGVGDRMQVSAFVSVAASLQIWLEDPAGTRVAALFSRPVGAGTTTFSWGGGAGSGQPVADGLYRLVAEATAGAERTTHAVSVVVDRTLGRFVARPAAFSPNGDGRLDVLQLGFDLLRPADVRVRVLRGSRTAAILFSGQLAGGARQVLPWNGRGPSGRVVTNGRYRAMVEATTALGTRRLVDEVVVDTVRPRVLALSARRRGRGTLVRLRLSEPARLVLRFGGRTVRVWRGSGRVSVWRRVASRRVRVVAWDVAGNASRRASARVRR